MNKLHVCCKIQADLSSCKVPWHLIGPFCLVPRSEMTNQETQLLKERHPNMEDEIRFLFFRECILLSYHFLMDNTHITDRNHQPSSATLGSLTRPWSATQPPELGSIEKELLMRQSHPGFKVDFLRPFVEIRMLTLKNGWGFPHPNWS